MENRNESKDQVTHEARHIDLFGRAGPFIPILGVVGLGLTVGAISLASRLLPDSLTMSLEERWSKAVSSGTEVYRINRGRYGSQACEYVDVDSDGDYDIGRTEGVYWALDNGTTREMLVGER